MAKEKKENSANDKALEYFINNPGYMFASILLTSDGTVFYPTTKGMNAAANHSNSLEDRSIVEVQKP